MLPDEVLLAIFDFYVVANLYQDLYYDEIPDRGIDDYPFANIKIQSWQSLVHVCQHWRSIVFGSQSRLNLQLCCTTRTPAVETVDVWPALPLVIQDYVSGTSVDDLVAHLKLSDRIRQIKLCFRTSESSRNEELWTTMQAPFPELSVLFLKFDSSYTPVLPDSFLDGSAPRLRSFVLEGIPFPRIPNLLLSATHLVYLCLLEPGTFHPRHWPLASPS